MIGATPDPVAAVISASTRISNWDQLLNWRNKTVGDGVWVFRGQGDIGEPLKTSIERFCMDARGSLERASKIEDFVLREFRRRYHHYSTHSPADNDRLEWYSIMQHHGAPTRLLDFTYSLWVAVYIAIERLRAGRMKSRPEKSENPLPGVWCFKKETMIHEAFRLAGGDGEAKKFFLEPTELNEGALFQNVLTREGLMLVSLKNPYQLNQRQSIQRGVFMVPSKIECPLVDCLSKMTSSLAEASRLEFDLQNEERERWLDELFHMGISNETLFPGLDGFARTLAVYNPVVMKRVKG